MNQAVTTESDLTSLAPGTDRTLSILEILSDNPMGMTVAEIVRTLEIPQNSVFRITATLHNRGYLHRREDDKRFLLSNKFFDLVRPKSNGKSLVVCAYESLKQLAQETGETSQLIVRAGQKGLVLEQVVGRHPIKVMGEIGLHVPLYSCAPGKAILAFLPEDELEEWLGQVRLKKFTSTTRSNRELLLKDLREIRERGFATDLAEGLDGIHCLAAPIFNEYQYPVAAVTVMAPIFRLPPDQFDRLGRICIDVAREIEKRLSA